MFGTPWLFGLLLLSAGCTTPDVSQEINETQAAFDELVKNTRPAVAEESAQEILQAEEILVANGDQAVAVRGDCRPAAEAYGVPIAAYSGPCRLESQANLVKPGIPANATQVLALETALAAYLLALANLANATSVNDAQKHTANLIASLDALAARRASPQVKRLAKAASEDKDRIVGAVGFVVNQYRHNALRRAVARAESVLEEAGPVLVAYHSKRNPAVERAAKALNDAQLRANEARENGTPAQHRAAIAEIKRAFAVREALASKDPALWYVRFLRAHTALHAQLQGGGDLDDLSAAIDALAALKPKTPDQ
ncbi:MAG: hypothetical protein AAFQ58_12095 [Pseudomonadota bacterium]